MNILLRMRRMLSQVIPTARQEYLTLKTNNTFSVIKFESFVCIRLDETYISSIVAYDSYKPLKWEYNLVAWICSNQIK